MPVNVAVPIAIRDLMLMVNKYGQAVRIDANTVELPNGRRINASRTQIDRAIQDVILYETDGVLTVSGTGQQWLRENVPPDGKWNEPA